MKQLLLILFLISLLGCNKIVSKQELLTYISDPSNGLQKKEQKNGCDIEAVYRPADLIVFQEIKGTSFSSPQIDSMKNYYQEFSYFLLRLSRDGKEITIPYASDPVKFNQVNDYLGFTIGKDVYLIQDHDTVKVHDFIHTRTFGSSPSSDVLFAFKIDLKKRNEQVRLIFDDHQFGLGFNEFLFEARDIKSAPSIDLTIH